MPSKATNVTPDIHQFETYLRGQIHDLKSVHPLFSSSRVRPFISLGVFLVVRDTFDENMVPNASDISVTYFVRDQKQVHVFRVHFGVK